MSMYTRMPELEKTITHPDKPRHRMVLKKAEFPIKAWLNNAQIAETSQALLVLEVGNTSYDPVTYFPQEDVNMDMLIPTEAVTHCPLKGYSRYFDIVINGNVHKHAAWQYYQMHDFDKHLQYIAGRIAFDAKQVELGLLTQLHNQGVS